MRAGIPSSFAKPGLKQGQADAGTLTRLGTPVPTVAQEGSSVENPAPGSLIDQIVRRARGKCRLRRCAEVGAYIAAFTGSGILPWIDCRPSPEPTLGHVIAQLERNNREAILDQLQNIVVHSNPRVIAGVLELAGKNSLSGWASHHGLDPGRTSKRQAHRPLVRKRGVRS